MTQTGKRVVTWSIIGGVLAGIIAILVIGSHSVSGSAVPPIDANVDHLLGPTTAKAMLFEYSDFQCPACGAYEPLVQQVKAKYGDKLTLVYREYPLRQVHPDAQIAAQAAEAANLQGKFWEFHDLLFARQGSWPQSLDAKKTMIDYAAELKLDVPKFTTDIDSQAVKDRINRDVATGDAAKIPGTPTFFLNGNRITSQTTLDGFSKLIDPLLNS